MKSESMDSILQIGFYFGFGNVAVTICDAESGKKKVHYIGANGTYSLEVADEALFWGAFRWKKKSAEVIRAATVGIIKKVGAEVLSEFAESHVLSQEELVSLPNEYRDLLFDALSKSDALSEMGLRVKMLSVEGIFLRGENDPVAVVVPQKKRRKGKNVAIVTASLLLTVIIFVAAFFASGIIGGEEPPTVDDSTTTNSSTTTSVSTTVDSSTTTSSSTTVYEPPVVDEPRLKAYLYGDIYRGSYLPEGWGFGCAGDFWIVLKYDGNPIEDMENVSIEFANPSAGVITVGEHGKIYFHSKKEASSDIIFSYKGSKSIHAWLSFEDIGIAYSERLELIMDGFTEPVYYGFGNIVDFFCILKYDGNPIEDMENVTVNVKDPTAGRVEIGKEPGQLWFYNLREAENIVTISYRDETLGRVWLSHASS